MLLVASLGSILIVGLFSWMRARDILLERVLSQLTTPAKRSPQRQPVSPIHGQIAAIALRVGGPIISSDQNFARFSGIDWRDPLR
jgi:hypothetical protein